MHWLIVLMLLGTTGVGRAAVIGVLDDDRQAGEGGFLSLMGGSSAAARQALLADGHTLVTLDSVPPASASVDVLWLPLLASSSTYEVAEAVALKQYVVDGGSIVFIGGPDVYNVPDNSFLNEFGLSKIEGNLSAAATPSLLDHPVVSGPHGAVGSIGSTGGYGLFASVADVADVFVAANEEDPPVSGTVAGFLSPGAEASGAGRVAFICDPFMFGPSLDETDRDHRALLRNLVNWAAAAEGYTPSGTSVGTGAMTAACGVCDTIASVEMVFSSVSETGESTVVSLGTGRCGFDGAIPEPLPQALRDFVGYGLDLSTSAVYAGAIQVVAVYDPAALSELGITDASALEVWWVHPVSTDLISVTATVDDVANTVSFQATQLGAFLIGADVDSFVDCDGNGLPDECQSAVPMTFVVDAVGGGSVTPAGSYSYPVCQTVPITASPNAGYCFGGWTVDGGAGPADPLAKETSVEVDVAKTVTAAFVTVIADQPSDQFACSGGTASFSISVDQSQSGATFAWQRGGVPLVEGGRYSGVQTEALAIDPVQPDDAGLYRCVVTYACNEGEEDAAVTSEGALLTVGEAPVITLQPVSGIVCMGNTIELSVEAQGTAPLVFRWWKDGTEIEGSSGSTFTITDAETGDGGAYHVVVSNACGADVTSQTVTVDVQDRPTIDVQPANGTRCEGEAFEFSVETSGGEPLLYQWRRDGATLAGATDRVLTIDPVTAVDAGEYLLIVQNANGCGAVTSEAAELIVEVAPHVVQGPVDQAVCEAGLLVLDVAAAGTEPLYYQWHKDGVPIDGETDAGLSVSAVQPVDAGAYSVLITNNTDCGTATSDPVIVTVLPPTVVIADPVGQSICIGGTATFSIVATGADLRYQWSFRASGAQQFIDLADGTGVSGANAAALVLSSAGIGREGEYRCAVFSDCSNPYISPIVLLNVTPGACDCNDNETPDEVDLANGTSADCDGDGVPDECQLTGGDCQGDGIPDLCQLTDNDCDGDEVPDDCQLAGADCNGDGILDTCQLSGNDCNGNGIPDDCEPAFSVDVGADVNGCVGEFVQLSAVIDAGAANPPFNHTWRIVSGPEIGATIIGGASLEPDFEATLPGAYVIEVAVADSSNPPCVALDFLTIAVEELQIAVGAGFRMCATGTSGPLSVEVLNGSGTYSYEWTIEAGSPSDSLAQLTGGGPEAADPTFTPDVPGAYVARVTVEDLGGSGCAASETIAIHAAGLEVTGPSAFGMCVDGVSPPLSLDVSAADPATLAYQWGVEDGSPNLDLGQFTGGGPTAPNPTFQPNSTGTYLLRATVRDDSEPPCEASVAFELTVGAMTVDAGPDLTACVGSGVRLAPTVNGAVGNVVYSWSIEAGSPSADPAQFSDPHSFGETPLFSPSSRGVYSLRLTVRDGGTPACEASDIVIVRATELNVDAGENLVTQAFVPSRTLGAVPLASGGEAPYVFRWRVLGGPSLDSAQFSNAAAEHPTFTPAATGTYLLDVSVAEANGVCVVTDTIAVEAITSAETRTVNVEGRMFMTLRLNDPHTRAEARVSQATPGAAFEGRLIERDGSVSTIGMAPPAGLNRQLTVTTGTASGPYVVVIAVFYHEDEVASLLESELRLHQQASDGRWYVAGSMFVGAGPYPLRASRSDVGKFGVDEAGNCVWAVLNFGGTFAIGFPDPVASDSPSEQVATDPVPQGSTAPELMGGPMCGAAVAGGTMLCLAGLLVGMVMVRSGRLGIRRHDRKGRFAGPPAGE